MSKAYDLVILGGGCAGLSLAAELSRQGQASPRTLVLESRSKYQNDRTWCFWDGPNARATHLASHRWYEMKVSNAHTTAIVPCVDRPYAMVPASAFYQYALDAISANPHITLRLDSPITGCPSKQGNLWRLQVRNTLCEAAMVVDTRPARGFRPGDATLWQSFSGVEVTTTFDEFNPERVTLMEFRHTAAGRILFTYLLPLSRRRALVEVTQFSPFPAEPGSLERDLHEALRHHVLGGVQLVLRRESGILPMGSSRRFVSDDASFVYAGLHAGGARPCTGYAFQRIQRWAADCARNLANEQPPIGHRPDPSWMQAMDQLFLNVLRSRPDIAPSMFVSLFAGTDSSSVIRFLSDEAGVADVLGVVSSLPAYPFLKELGSIFRTKATQWQESFVS